jgi:hypothetical protein
MINLGDMPFQPPNGKIFVSERTNMHARQKKEMELPDNENENPTSSKHTHADPYPHPSPTRFDTLERITTLTIFFSPTGAEVHCCLLCFPEASGKAPHPWLG